MIRHPLFDYVGQAKCGYYRSRPEHGDLLISLSNPDSTVYQILMIDFRHYRKMRKGIREHILQGEQCAIDSMSLSNNGLAVEYTMIRTNPSSLINYAADFRVDGFRVDGITLSGSIRAEPPYTDQMMVLLNRTLEILTTSWIFDPITQSISIPKPYAPVQSTKTGAI